MIYDLNNPLDAENYKLRCNQLWSKQSENGRRCVIEVTEKCSRTLKQNAYLHVIIAFFACQYGTDADYVKEEYFKGMCNRDIFMVSSKTDKLTGKTVVKYRSSSDISKEQMTVCIERFRKWSAEVAHIYLPSADEKDKIMAAEIEIKKAERYMI